MKTDTEPPPVTPAREVNYGRLLLGVILVIGGIGWLLDAANILQFDWAIFLSIALIVDGLAIIGIRGGMRSRSAMVAIGTVLTVILAIGAIDLNRPLRGSRRITEGVGEKTLAPRRVGDIPDRYRLQFGSLVLDLTQLDLPSGTTDIKASVGTGKLIVELPRATAFDVEGRVGAGQLKIPDDIERSGANLSEKFVTEDYSSADKRILLGLSVGLGDLEVRRGPS
jgi:cell wall-active antibiotic response 4TMS protein YvqF